MECEVDEREHPGDTAGIVRDGGVGEVPSAQVEGPGPIACAVRLNDGSGGPVRVEIDLLVERISPAKVVREFVRGAIVDARIVGHAVPVQVPELYDGIEFHCI